MKTNRIFLWMLGYFATLSALQGLQAQPPGLSYPVPLDEAHFPDKVFREYLWYNIDENEDGQLSVEECGAVEEILIYYSGVTSLEGIEYFYALTELNCSGNDLTSLDVSKNTALTELNCSGNDLTSLDLSQNTALKNLYCDNNQLTSLDVSKNTALTELNCSGNDLTSLDLSKNTALTELNCSGNDLTSLDLSKNTALTFLDYSYNDLTSLDLSRNTSLTYLNCSDNDLTSLDVSRNTNLIDLYCSDNHLAALDLSQNGRLLSVNAGRNYYEVSLDEAGNVDIAVIPGLEADRMTGLQGGYIEGNTLHLDAGMLMYYYDYKCLSPNAPSGGYFYIAANNPAYCIPIDKEHFPDTAFRRYVTDFDRDEDEQLSPGEIRMVTDIGVSNREIHDLRGIEHFAFLQFLNCSANNLASLDVSQNTTLTGLDCSDNQLTSLDLSRNTSLMFLICSDNQLTSLDLSRNTALLMLECSNNALQDLDVSGILALGGLDCSKNQLASLDLSQNAKLASVKADSNYREVFVNRNRQFYISSLPRFEIARMEEIEGGFLQGNILTFTQDEVRYFYSYNNANSDLPSGEYFHLKAVPDSIIAIINDTTFPDAAFRGYIAGNADTDKDGQLGASEILGVTGIDVSSMGIRDLRGIEYFTFLQFLDCSANQLTVPQTA